MHKSLELNFVNIRRRYCRTGWAKN